MTIAENLAGTEQNFARVMTREAQELGMMSTLFRNASGLPNDEQVTTARDMAVLAQHLIETSRNITAASKRNISPITAAAAIATTIRCCSATRAPTASRRVHQGCWLQPDRFGPARRQAPGRGGAWRQNGGQRDAAMRALLDQSFPKAVAGRPRPVETAPWWLALKRQPRRRPARRRQEAGLCAGFGGSNSEPVSLDQDDTPTAAKLAPHL